MTRVEIWKPEGFDWDGANRDKNWRKHKVGFLEREQIFFNSPINFFADGSHSQKEQRFLALGKTNNGRKLTIVFTRRREKIRVISARDQNRKEGMVYG